jgi:hypothetical protein
MTAPTAAPTPAPTPPVPRSWRHEAVRGLAVFGLALVILLPVVWLDRPPTAPRLTFIGGEGLSMLLEGAGGGRVLIGGGGGLAEAPAALGRQWWPWNRQLDLLVVLDRRDLPGATELAWHGDVRAVALLGLADDQQASAALAALREACARRAIPLEEVTAGQRVTLGRDASLIVDLAPALTGTGSASVWIAAGPLALTIAGGGAATLAPVNGALVPRASQDAYRAAFATGATLLIAPASPTSLPDQIPPGAYLLLVGPGERATLTIFGNTMRLRGPVPQPLDNASAHR